MPPRSPWTPHTIRWTIEKIAQRLDLIAPLVHRRRQPLASFRYRALNGPGALPPLGAEVDDSAWISVGSHQYWASWDTNFVLRGGFQTPSNWAPGAPQALYIPLGEFGEFEHPEALAYINGEPYAAIDRHHQEILLPQRFRDGQPHRLALHGWTGIGEGLLSEPGKRPYMGDPALVQIDEPLRAFCAAARVALGVARELEENDPKRGLLLNSLDEAFKLLDTRFPQGDAFYGSIPAAHASLLEGVQQAGAALDVEVIAAGHAHIDIAWLWTLAQTRHKARRTFTNVLRLMEQFPDYHFTQSQAQLYEFVRQDDPTLFEAIRQRIAEGRWEPVGGTWVEMDCNLSGSEALARQFLLGRSFFREHFGSEVDTPALWLPDVFGYAWNLPQLIKQAGYEYFFTIKIGWNQYNRLPYDSFWWQGLDGTRVLTHFSPTPDEGAFASTYNAQVTPAQVMGTWKNFQQKEIQHTLLMAYGFGDGGGGPTRQMLENAAELQGFPGAPRLRLGRVGDFFRRMEAESGERLPVWNGELYLEYHRGTYTTQARNKRMNRKSEFALHDAEFLAAQAWLESGAEYPQEALDQAWKLVCLNQFHDILPGSSITPVYSESQAQYAEVLRLAEQVRSQALNTLAEGRGAAWLVANPTSFTRHDLLFYAGDGSGLPEGIRYQVTQGGAWIEVGELAPYSVTPLVPGAPLSTGSLLASPELLENDFLRVEFNQDGEVVRIFDKHQRRDVLPPGAIANQWQAFEDRPLNFDAWDIDIFYDDKMWLAAPASTVQVVESGPLRATLEIRRQILNSPITQRISLAHNSPRLDFHTRIDWRERNILLKVAFPVEVFAPVATHEIQWGNVQRPTHRNTSWDWARFETCAHKWVDLSEGDYGVSLLNDCKYGHDVRDNVLRLTLLRGPMLPDPLADLGEQEFIYSLLPHAGGWGQATLREAYALNDPLQLYFAGEPSPAEVGRGISALVEVDAPNVIIETVKRAEDGRGLVVRLYECMRRRGEVTLHSSFKLAGAERCNLLEEAIATVETQANTLRFFIKPYEIISMRLYAE